MYDWAELRHFRYLLTILERQGFRVAAEELHTSQPNLSVQARQFQENASVRLYKKLKNGDWALYELQFLDLMRARKIEEKISPGVLDAGCLLCSEEKPHHCHRRLVAEYLKTSGAISKSSTFCSGNSFPWHALSGSGEHICADGGRTE